MRGNIDFIFKRSSWWCTVFMVQKRKHDQCQWQVQLHTPLNPEHNSCHRPMRKLHISVAECIGGHTANCCELSQLRLPWWEVYQLQISSWILFVHTDHEGYTQLNGKNYSWTLCSNWNLGEMGFEYLSVQKQHSWEDCAKIAIHDIKFLTSSASTEYLIAHRWGSLLCITLNIWVMCWASSDPHLWAMLDNSLTLDWYCVKTPLVANATRVVLTQYQSRARELSYT